MRVKTRIFIIISISLTATSIVGDFFNKNSSYQIENNENTIYQSPLCGCKKAIPIGESNSDKGVNWCSKESTMRGPHQSVVTYSLFGEATRMGPVYKYFRLLNTISKQIGHFYPGWKVRIYHNIGVNQRIEREFLCQMYCQNDNVDLCEVNEITNNLKYLGDMNLTDAVSKLNFRMWRFLPLMDPMVDRFMSRDTDSEINEREVAAVNQWLESNYTFHVMRDHQEHCAAILAGMFGAKTALKRKKIQQLTADMITLGNDQIKTTDQALLEKIFWPTVKDDAIIHDSYCCELPWLRGNLVPISPFPTERLNFSFASARANGKVRQEKCPEKCRPPEHPEWEYC